MGHRITRSPRTRPHHTPATDTAGHDADDYLRLIRALNACGKLLTDLAALLPEPASQGPATGTIGRHAPESSEPWNSEAAGAYWGIYFGCRHLADRMRAAAGMEPGEWPAGRTQAAMSAIAALATAVPPDQLAAARLTAERWVAAALRIPDIDQGETWSPVPRVPGVAPPECPYCHTLALRMSLTRMEVRCFHPTCRDADGNPVRARMERGRISGEGRLYFGDGTVVAYREES